MRLEERLIELYPEMEGQLKSEQYRLSEIIVTEKVRRGLTPDEMAELMGIEVALYLQLELADMTIMVKVYEKALQQFESSTKTNQLSQ